MYLLALYSRVFRYNSEANHQRIILRNFLSEPGGFAILPLEK
jgi:hypothetical protein